ncbi:MAG: hypothetical protein ACREQT_06895 [Candidatus Binataceae bacterium]
MLKLEGYVIDGVTAIAVEGVDPSALARAVENLTNEPNRRSALTEAATQLRPDSLCGQIHKA